MPSAGWFVLDTQVPLSRLSDDLVKIVAEPVGTEAADTVVELQPDQPFPFLSQLPEALLTENNGRMFAQIPNPQ